MTYAKYLRVTQFDRDHIYSDVSWEMQADVLYIFEGDGKTRDCLGIVVGIYVVSFCEPNGVIPK